MTRPYYITTAISYPNGRPHIGHAYEAVAADVLARFQRLMGRDVRFQTGTDEHGLKMAQKARELGVEPRALADEMSAHFIEMCDRLNVSYDRFIRTTETMHHVASQALWQAMAANDDLYQGRYEGWYSVRDEAYYAEGELILAKGEDGTGQRLSPQGTPVEWTVEESWFFRLSRYQEPLLDLYRSRPDFIQPEGRRNEVMRFVEGGLNDLSISRTSFDWGVKVPDSDGHLMYVWVDALTNYLTGLGYPDETAEMAKYWPAELHLIGKDIVRFHAVYWPAFLLSAGLPLPRRVFGHGFLLNRGQKESKSVGNVTDPLTLVDRYGADVLRYYFMRDVSFGQDGSYSPEAIAIRANADLSNSFGNLAQRVLSFIHKNCERKLPAIDLADLVRADSVFLETIKSALDDMVIQFERLSPDRALAAWMNAVFAANAYVDEQAPWTLRKTDMARMNVVLCVLVWAIRELAIALQPVCPAATAVLLDNMGLPTSARGFVTGDGPLSVWPGEGIASLATTLSLFPDGRVPSPIFPRLVVPEVDAETGV